MFKFYSKGDNADCESALFYNGQRILTIHARRDADMISIMVDDGTDTLQGAWEDYLEDYENAD